MPATASKAMMRRLFTEGFNQGKLSIVDELFDPQFVDHSTPEQPIGPGGVKEYIAQIRADFPDLHIIIDDLIAEEETIVVRTTWRATQQGTVLTGTMIQIFRIRDGKIFEEWNEGSGLN